MAAVLTLTCDRCGVELDRDRPRLDVACGPFRDRLPNGLDLCPTCFEALISSWLAAGQAAPNAAPAAGVMTR
jgi:hypothetical protein